MPSPLPPPTGTPFTPPVRSARPASWNPQNWRDTVDKQGSGGGGGGGLPIAARRSHIAPGLHRAPCPPARGALCPIAVLVSEGVSLSRTERGFVDQNSRAPICGSGCCLESEKPRAPQSPKKKTGEALEPSFAIWPRVRTKGRPEHFNDFGTFQFLLIPRHSLWSNVTPSELVDRKLPFRGKQMLVNKYIEYSSTSNKHIQSHRPHRAPATRRDPVKVIPHRPTSAKEVTGSRYYLVRCAPLSE